MIARLECLGFDTDVRTHLDRWADHEDSAVRAEARQQTAVLRLYDTMQREDLAGVRQRLEEARVAFARAELGEEDRLNARLFLSLIDLLLAYLATLSSDSADASALRTQAQGLASPIANPMGRSWYGYASSLEALLEYRMYRIADGFGRLADAIQGAEEWTSFDEALVELGLRCCD